MDKSKLCDKKIDTYLRQFEAIKRSILDIGPFRKATILKLYNVCGKPNCKCKKAKKFRHGPYLSWSAKKNGKTVTFNVPSAFSGLSNQYLANAKALDQIISELSALSELIIKHQIELAKKLSKN